MVDPEKNMKPEKYVEAPRDRAPEPYESPLLRCLGDLRDMTLGGSLGTGDSGNPGVQRF